MSIKKAISQWDGKSADYIGGVYSGYANTGDVQTKGFAAELIQLCVHAETQKGATWLLKQHLEQGGGVSTAQGNEIYRVLPALEDWESKLHILQSVPYLPITEEAKGDVASFLRTCLSERNKFVRAWAYNGWYELATQHAEYKAEAKELLEAGLEEEAASVRARIRNIMKQGEFLL